MSRTTHTDQYPPPSADPARPVIAEMRFHPSLRTAQQIATVSSGLTLVVDDDLGDDPDLGISSAGAVHTFAQRSPLSRVSS